ncbi:MAG: cytochrome P450 [Bdellovibrionales bacterium]|nr:cytochrome P450 [Massilia sp.]
MDPVAHAWRSVDSLPGPKGIPLLGNALQFKSHNMHLQFEAWAGQFGPFYQLRLGSRRIMVVADHKATAAMLRDRPDGFSRSARIAEIWNEMGLPNGVFGANGDAWQRQRRMVMASFDPGHVKRYFPALKEVSARLAERWNIAARDQVPIDLQADLMRFTVDTIAGLAFGAKVNTLESDGDIIQQNLDRIFPALFKRMFSPIPIWRWLPSRADRALAVSLVKVMEAVNSFVAQARERMALHPALREHPENLLEAMIAAADQPGSGIDDSQVAGNVLTMLLAGEDTTANTLAWMIHLLWQNPEALAKAVAEVREVCGDARGLTLEHMARLDYVEACANETMRLKPVAPFIGFQSLRDSVVGGVAVPAGTMILAVMRHDSISEEHVRNAAAFSPERWLDENNAAMNPASAKRISMPFGGGPRICPGRYLALLEMKMAMATLLGRFDIESLATPDGGEPREHMALTMQPIGLRMRVNARPADSAA